MAASQVAGDLLRGRDRPGLVAVAQGLAAVFTVVLLVVLLPSTGVAAAAIASSVAYGVGMAVMIRCLWRLPVVGQGVGRRSARWPARQVFRTGRLVRIGESGRPGRTPSRRTIIAWLSALGHDPVPLGRSIGLCGRTPPRAASIVRKALPALDERGQQRIARSALEERLRGRHHRRAASDGGRGAPAGDAAGQGALWFPDSLVNLAGSLVLLAPYDALSSRTPTWCAGCGPRSASRCSTAEACSARSSPSLGTPAPTGTLVIAGNMYPSRIRLLERLLAAGIPLRLYGRAFRAGGTDPLRAVHAGRCIFQVEKAEVFRSAVACSTTCTRRDRRRQRPPVRGGRRGRGQS